MRIIKQDFRSYYHRTMEDIEKSIKKDLVEIQKEHPLFIVLLKDVKLLLCGNENIEALAIFDICS